MSPRPFSLYLQWCKLMKCWFSSHEGQCHKIKTISKVFKWIQCWSIPQRPISGLFFLVGFPKRPNRTCPAVCWFIYFYQVAQNINVNKKYPMDFYWFFSHKLITFSTYGQDTLYQLSTSYMKLFKISCLARKCYGLAGRRTGSTLKMLLSKDSTEDQVRPISYGHSLLKHKWLLAHILRVALCMSLSVYHENNKKKKLQWWPSTKCAMHIVYSIVQAFSCQGTWPRTYWHIFFVLICLLIASKNHFFENWYLH